MKTIPPTWAAESGADPEVLIQEARRRQRHRYLLTGLVVAAVAVAAFAVTPVLTGNSATTSTAAGFRPVSEPVSYSSPPAYYANLIQGEIWQNALGSEGVTGRYIEVRATSTGKLLTTVSPPMPYNNFILLSATANGRMFVFGAMRYWQTSANASPRVRGLARVTPLKFVVLVITAGGRAQLSQLSLPGTLTPAQNPTIALSPDGTKLAEAYGGGGSPAVVRVITLATGKVRQWVSRPVPWTPVFKGDNDWTADGRTLVFEQPVNLPAQASRYRPPTATYVRLLDITGPGTSLTSARLVVLRAPRGQMVGAYAVITPDGTKLICVVGSKKISGPIQAEWSGGFAVYSAHTGALLQILAPWTWHRPPLAPGGAGVPRPAVLWSNRSGSQLLILLPKNNLNVLGMLAGNTFVPARSDVLPQPDPQSTGG